MEDLAKKQSKTLQVTDSLSVEVHPDHQHEFFMHTKQVALGYGITEGSLRAVKSRYSDELVNGKHFVQGVANRNAGRLPGTYTLWTKAGVVRLGFFVRSERAKLFRTWAEHVILHELEKQQESTPHDAMIAKILELQNPDERKALYRAYNNAADWLAKAQNSEISKLRSEMQKLEQELDVKREYYRGYLLAEKARILKKKPQNRTLKERATLDKASNVQGGLV